MDKVTTQRVQILNDISKLEEIVRQESSNSIVLNSSTKYRYCLIRAFAGYNSEEWERLIKWASSQEGYMHFVYDEEKDALLFDSSPNILMEVGFKRDGLYIYTEDNFDPKIIMDGNA